MIWTKLKRTAEPLLADTLQGRIEYHLTRYGNGVSHFMSRGWITLDRTEIANFSTIGREREIYSRTGNWYSHDPQVLSTLEQEGIFTRDDYVSALHAYVGLQMKDALRSVDPIVRAISMFDRRLGKRRLRTFCCEDEHPLVKQFFKIRCEAEELELRKDDG